MTKTKDEVGVYLFKPRSEEFTIYRVPLTSNQELLNKVLEKEQKQITDSEKKDYFKVFSFKEEGKKAIYFVVDSANVSDKIKNFVADLIINSPKISSISEYKLRKNAKDPFPFDSFAIFRKNKSGTFQIGVSALSDQLKVYKKFPLFLRLFTDDYSVCSTSSTILIPNYVFIMINGKWDNNKVEVQEVCIKENKYPLFEKMFSYRHFWEDKAGKIIEKQEKLIINGEAWTNFSGDIRNTRKFVRTINTKKIDDEQLTLLEKYSKRDGLKGKLGFSIVVKNGIKAISCTTDEGIKNFIDGVHKNILPDPFIKAVWYRAHNKEQVK